VVRYIVNDAYTVFVICENKIDVLNKFKTVDHEQAKEFAKVINE